MSSYLEGRIHQLADAFEVLGYTPDQIRRLGENERGVLGLLYGVLNGTHQIVPVEYSVNLVSTPKLPFPGAVVTVHKGEGVVKLERRGDDLYVDGQRIALHRSKLQGRGSLAEFMKRLDKRGGGLNACVLDYLEAHSELWPESWKEDLLVVFGGTTFRSADKDYLYVRTGAWHSTHGKVVSSYSYLGHRCSPEYVAATTVS